MEGGVISHDPSEELLETMVRLIKSHRAGKLPYYALVSQLDAGVGGLLDRDADVRDALHKEWWVLEEVNALALDEGSWSPLPEHQEIADQALNRFLQIAEQRLGMTSSSA